MTNDYEPCGVEITKVSIYADFISGLILYRSNKTIVAQLRSWKLSVLQKYLKCNECGFFGIFWTYTRAAHQKNFSVGSYWLAQNKFL